MWQLIKVWAPVVRDVWGLIIGTLGVILAYLAIKLGKEQTKIGVEQKVFAERQTAISERQAEISEQQFRISQEQLGRRANLEMSITDGTPIAEGRTQCRLYIHNKGNRTVSEFNWELILPCKFEPWVSLSLPAPFQAEVELQALGMEVCRVFKGHRTEPIYPEVQHELATLSWVKMKPEWGNLILYWKIFCEDGAFPPKEFGYLNLPLYR